MTGSQFFIDQGGNRNRSSPYGFMPWNTLVAASALVFATWVLGFFRLIIALHYSAEHPPVVLSEVQVKWPHALFAPKMLT